MNQKTRAFSSLMLALLVASATNAGPAWSQLALGQGSGESAPAQPRVRATGFVTYWSHDATGYHPAIIMRVENASGSNLSGQQIKFQAQFRDLRNGYVTVARKEVRWEFYNNQENQIVLRGPNAFELPIDEFQWPVLEAKVMCRIGSADDDGTQTLLLEKLDHQTMTDEEASSRLAKITPFIKTGPGIRPKTVKGEHHSHAEEKPLVATALPLGADLKAARAAAASKTGLSRLLSMPRLPGLGEDFYEFDQILGKAIEFAPSKDRWTWVHYENNSVDVFVAAKGHLSKADTVVAVIPSYEVNQESQLLTLARALSGKFKSQMPDSPTRSVKYLPGGRIQMANFSAPGYKGFYVNPRGSGDDNNYVLVISRLAGDLRATLSENVKRTQMLKFMQIIVQDAEPE